MSEDTKYSKQLKKMSDEELIQESEKQEKLANETAHKKNWFVAERKTHMAALELYNRGYIEKTIWVKDE